MNELINIFKHCEPEAIRKLVQDMKDEKLKVKLFFIIRKHFPHLEYIVKEAEAETNQNTQQAMIGVQG